MIEITAAFPVFVAQDLGQLENFYSTYFGFQAVFADHGFYIHLAHPDSGVQLGFLVPEHTSQPAFLHPLTVTEGMVISFETADAEQAWNQAVSMHLEIAMDLKTETWGQKHFMVRDPAGFIIDIVEHQ